MKNPTMYQVLTDLSVRIQIFWGCDAEWDSGSHNFECRWAATGPKKQSYISEDVNHQITLKFVESYLVCNI